MKSRSIPYTVLLLLLCMNMLFGCAEINDSPIEKSAAETSTGTSAETVSDEKTEAVSEPEEISEEISSEESEDESMKMFDKDNIILKIGLMSDFHFDAINTYTENYANNTDIVCTAVNFLKEKFGEDDLPAIVIGGDIDNWNGIADLQMAKAAFEKCLDPSKTELIPTVGNHDDWCTNGKEPVDNELSGKKVFVDYNLFKEILGSYVYHDTSLTPTEAMLTQGFYHTSINGIHFISVTGVDGDHGYQSLVNMTKELDKIRSSEDAGKPVFIITHTPPRNTVVGTEYDEKVRWTSDTIANSLKNYPEAVLLTGHTHAKADTKDVLWQEDSFTVLHSGCIGEEDHSFASLEIDINGCIRYTGYHVVRDRKAKTGWSVEAYPGCRFAFETKQK